VNHWREGRKTLQQRSGAALAAPVILIVLAIGFIFRFQRSRTANAPPPLKIAPPPGITGIKGPT
jgi:hypothetical protein